MQSSIETPKGAGRGAGSVRVRATSVIGLYQSPLCSDAYSVYQT